MKQFLLLQVYTEAQIRGNFKNLKALGRKRLMLQPVRLEPQLPWRQVPATVTVKARKWELNLKLKLW